MTNYQPNSYEDAAKRRVSSAELLAKDPVRNPVPTPKPLATEAEDTPAPPKKRRETGPASTRDQFTGALQPLQVKVPEDMIQSLKLHAISSGKTMSEIVLDGLTSTDVVSKAWVSTRQAG
jgi:hypothetical protein